MKSVLTTGERNAEPAVKPGVKPGVRPVVAPFPVSRALIMTDEELGKLLLEWFTTCEAAQRGLTSLDLQFADSVRRRLLETELETEPHNASVAAFEEALRLAARGDSARAGRLFREFMRGAGDHAKLMNYVTGDREKMRGSGSKAAATGRKASVGGSKASVAGPTAAVAGPRSSVAGRKAEGTSRKQQGEDTKTKVLNERHRLLNTGMAVRSLPRAIARKLEMDVQFVREIIRTASLK